MYAANCNEFGLELHVALKVSEVVHLLLLVFSKELFVARDMSFILHSFTPSDFGHVPVHICR